MSKILAIQSSQEPSPAWAAPNVTVSGFGSIASATMKVGGLTILVGQNNTGKSYAAMLLWAMRSLNSLISLRQTDGLQAPAWFSERMEEVENAGAGYIEIDGDQAAEALNAYFKKNKNNFMRRVMTLPNITVQNLGVSLSGKVYLHYLQKPPKGFGDFAKLGSEMRSWKVSWKSKISQRAPNSYSGFTSLGDTEAKDRLFQFAVNSLLSRNLGSFFSSANYVPAARTGLMLTLGYVASSLIGSLGFSGEHRGGRFSLPTIRFLQLLSNTQYNDFGGVGRSVADFLESGVLKGKISKGVEEGITYSYKPDACDHELPMHAVSSMVSELSPILAVLRESSLDGGLVLEEPEAHLHLSAQRYMARAIARLVNGGVPVVLTTHSDTFLQQINLLVRLKNHPDRGALMAKYGYSENELLDINDAEAYEFISENGSTKVNAAAKSEDGFVIRSLNEALFDITAEAMAIR